MYHTVRKLFFTECQCADGASKTYEELFAKLDANKDGKVDVAELKAGLAAMGISSGKGAAQVESLENTAIGCCALCAKSQEEGEEEGKGSASFSIFPNFHSPAKLKHLGFIVSTQKCCIGSCYSEGLLLWMLHFNRTE